jgi:hypothetical protein
LDEAQIIVKREMMKMLNNLDSGVSTGLNEIQLIGDCSEQALRMSHGIICNIAIETPGDVEIR